MCLGRLNPKQLREYYSISRFYLQLSNELIQINQLNEEAFFFEYNFNELNLNPGQKVVYNFSVWDNDKINGHKKTTK